MTSKAKDALAKAGNTLDKMRQLLADTDAATMTVEGWQEIAAKIGRLQASFMGAKKQVYRAYGITSPHEIILRYLQDHIYEVVNKDELSGVASIYEWARRVRELRVEHGWRIASNNTRDDLRPGEYRLEAPEPDEQLAEDWRTAKNIRNLTGANGRPAAGKIRLLQYLKAVHPRAASKDQLAYVTRNMPSRGRRIRELTEEGWQIDSSLDAADLAPGEYRMTALEMLPAKARQHIKLRTEVLDRDDHACQDCGRAPKKGDDVRLQVHHKLWVSHDGDNDPDNLITLCSECHAGRHAVEGSHVHDELLDPGSDPPPP